MERGDRKESHAWTLNSSQGRLLCRRTDERVGDGMDGERDAILYSYFAHHFGDVRLHRPLFNAERGCDLFVGKTRHQHFENLFLAVGNQLVGSGVHAQTAA